jgi:transposase
MHRAGSSVREIAQALHVGRSSVYGLLLQEEGSDGFETTIACGPNSEESGKHRVRAMSILPQTRFWLSDLHQIALALAVEKGYISPTTDARR